MPYKVSVVVVVDEDDADMAEAEVEAQLNDLLNASYTTISSFEIRSVKEIEIESED